MKTKVSIIIFILVLVVACAGGQKPSSDQPENTDSPTDQTQSPKPLPSRFFAGADLSYVNEMEDCGAVYRVGGEPKDPYEIFSEAGANLVRVRLWHNPDWTNYSNFQDVKKTIRRAKEAGLSVLLDLHYSDTWADPGKQFIPAAWESLYGDTEALGNALYDYTYSTLVELYNEGILPEMVQIGNETNNEILQLEDQMNVESINWERNAYLINRGLSAVSEFNQFQNVSVESMLHIAQPENALWWFADAVAAGVENFDLIGISYYGKWSEYKMDELEQALIELRETYEKDVLIVETSYLWTTQNFDDANNVMGTDSLLPTYPATESGQLNYMLDLSQIVINAGGIGVVVWEPAWVSTSCATLWGTGSHWENAAFFDSSNENEALDALGFFSIVFEEMLNQMESQ